MHSPKSKSYQVEANAARVNSLQWALFLCVQVWLMLEAVLLTVTAAPAVRGWRNKFPEHPARPIAPDEMGGTYASKPYAMAESTETSSICHHCAPSALTQALKPYSNLCQTYVYDLLCKENAESTEATQSLNLCRDDCLHLAASCGVPIDTSWIQLQQKDAALSTTCFTLAAHPFGVNTMKQLALTHQASYDTCSKLCTPSGLEFQTSSKVSSDAGLATSYMQQGEGHSHESAQDPQPNQQLSAISVSELDTAPDSPPYSFCLDRDDCWPSVLLAALVFFSNIFVAAYALLQTASLYSSGIYSENFWKGGGAFLVSLMAIVMLLAPIATFPIRKSITLSLLYSGGVGTLSGAFLLIGTRGAILGLFGGITTGVAIGLSIKWEILTLGLGFLIGLFVGLGIGFFPIARSLKINQRYVARCLQNTPKQGMDDQVTPGFEAQDSRFAEYNPQASKGGTLPPTLRWQRSSFAEEEFSDTFLSQTGGSRVVTPRKDAAPKEISSG